MSLQKFKQTTKSYSRFIYIPRGKINFLGFIQSQPKIYNNHIIKATYQNKKVKFFMCTQDRKSFFAKSVEGDLLFYNLETKKIEENFGKVYNELGDFIVTNYSLELSQKKTLMEFQNIETNNMINNQKQLNDKKKISKGMIQNRLVFGEYLVYSKDKKANKTSMAFTINNRTLHKQENLNQSTETFFQLYLEDARTSHEDEIYNVYEADFDCSLRITNINFFTIPNLYSPDINDWNFDFGVIAKGKNKRPHGLQLSQLCFSQLPPNITKFEAIELDKINCKNIETGIEFDIKLKMGDANRVVAMPVNQNYPRGYDLATIVSDNLSVHQIKFIAIKNSNGTFRLADSKNESHVLCVDRNNKNSCYRSVKWIVFKENSKEQQWYREGKYLVNLAGGYLTVATHNHKFEPQLYCGIRRNFENQWFEIDYVTLSNFVYIPQNNTDMRIEKNTVDEHLNNKIFIEGTENNKIISYDNRSVFIVDKDKQLLQYNIRKQTLVHNFGEVYLTFGNFFITGAKLGHHKDYKFYNSARKIEYMSDIKEMAEFNLLVKKNNDSHVKYGIIGNVHMEVPSGYDFLQKE